MEPTTIPIVSLAGDDAVETVARACELHGFLVVTDHGVDRSVIAEAAAATRAFFALDDGAKAAVRLAHEGYPYGWAPMRTERLAASRGVHTPPDLKETFSIGPSTAAAPADLDPEAADGFVFSTTPWPQQPAGFRSAMTAYYDALAGLAERLMRVFARALGLEPDFFDSSIDRHTSALRLLHYPAPTDPPEPGQLRAGAHSDYGTLTILLTDDAPGGLEVVTGDTWTPVPWVSDSFVVNLGDAMQRWTNDRWMSTVHRVVVPSDADAPRSERYSMAFFHNANWDAVIECLPTCLAAGETPRYPPVSAGQHLMDKFRSTQY